MSKNNLYDVICRCDEETHNIRAMADIMWACSRAADDEENADMDICTIQEGIRHISHALWNSSNALKEICEELHKIPTETEAATNE